MESKTILFVDDDQGIRDVMCDAITRWGYEPICVETSSEAVDVFQSCQPFLCLLDLRLNESTDGVLLAGKLHGLNPLCIFIAVTGNIGHFDIGYILGSVITDFLLKPVLLEDLKLVIEYAHEKYHRWMQTI